MEHRTVKIFIDGELHEEVVIPSWSLEALSRYSDTETILAKVYMQEKRRKDLEYQETIGDDIHFKTDCDDDEYYDDDCNFNLDGSID